MDTKNVLRVVLMLTVIAFFAVTFIGIQTPTVSAANTTAYVVVDQAVLSPAAMPPTVQTWVCWHHVDQGHGNHDETWDKWMPIDSEHGHDGHDGDHENIDTSLCGTPPPPPPPPDVCPNLDGLQETVPSGYQLVNGSCVPIPPPPPDVCPNLPGNQASVPDGYHLEDGNCVQNPPPPVDLCSNLDGVQTTVPNGYQIVAGQCVPIPTDVCPNLPGNQARVPEGYQLVNGSCVPIPPPVVDLCPNLTGVQGPIPIGYMLQNGLCVPIPPPPEQGCGQYQVVNNSSDVVEFHPGQSLIAIKSNHTQWALDIPPNPPDKLGLAFKGQVFGTGPQSNVNASWMTIFTWNGLKGWKAWWTFRAPQCLPTDDLIFTATDAGGITYKYVPGWQIDPAGPIQYKFY